MNEVCSALVIVVIGIIFGPFVVKLIGKYLDWVDDVFL